MRRKEGEKKRLGELALAVTINYCRCIRTLMYHFNGTFKAANFIVARFSFFGYGFWPLSQTEPFDIVHQHP
jgi:hypothetical protein